MGVLVGQTGEEDRWLTVGALPGICEGGEAAAPVVASKLGLPTPGRGLGDPGSPRGPQRVWVEPGEEAWGLQRRGEDNGEAAEGAWRIPLIRFFVRTLERRCELTTSARATVARGGLEGGGEVREGLEGRWIVGETLRLKAHGAFDDEGRDEQ